MNGRIRSASLLLACITALIRPSGVEAYFDRMYTSSRTLAMGGAFVSVCNDASATLVNPAGLTQIRGYSLLATLVKPYGLSNLEESYFAAALPLKIGVAGFSWHRFSLGGVSAEDLFTLAFGRDYIRTSLDASLSFGGSIDVARVSYSDRYNMSKAIATGSLGILLRPFPIIGIGYCVRNLGQNTFDFIPGGGKTPIKATHAWGVAYHWQQISFLFERQRGQNRIWRNHVGLEVRLPSGLHVRSGLNNGDVTGGVGLLFSNVSIDVGVTSHEAIGTSYMISLRYFVPGKDAAGDSKR